MVRWWAGQCVMTHLAYIFNLSSLVPHCHSECFPTMAWWNILILEWSWHDHTPQCLSLTLTVGYCLVDWDQHHQTHFHSLNALFKLITHREVWQNSQHWKTIWHHDNMYSGAGSPCHSYKCNNLWTLSNSIWSQCTVRFWHKNIKLHRKNCWQVNIYHFVECFLLDSHNHI
jgi:hypothetical protein